MTESAHLPFNFGGIAEEEFSDFERSRILVWPVAYEGTVSYGTGTGRGAEAIINASRNMELYDEETDSETYKLGIHTVGESPSIDPPAAMMDSLYKQACSHVSTGKFVCMLGGEHSVSGPVIRAHAEKYPNLSVLQIDAHADLRDTYDGTPHSHASIMARVTRDLKLPAVQCGIRSISAEEARSLNDLPTTIFWAKDIVGRSDWWDDAVDRLTGRGAPGAEGGNLYVSIDIDVLHLPIVPGTTLPEPGGLSWYETIGLIRTLARKRNVVGMDLTEYSYVEGFDASAFLCSKLVYKSLSFIFENQADRVRG